MEQVHINPGHCKEQEINRSKTRNTVASLAKRLIASGVLRFAGWWSIFAGVLALNSICPVCGRSACPIGIGTTGIITGLVAAIKLWGVRIIKAIIRIIRRSNPDDGNLGVSSGTGVLSHEHGHNVQH